MNSEKYKMINLIIRPVISLVIRLDKYINNYFVRKNNKYIYRIFSIISHSGSLIVIATIMSCSMILFYDVTKLPCILIIYTELIGLMIIIILQFLN